MALKAGITHSPEYLGFLFRKNNDGITSCQIAFERYGKDETLKVIQECTPADSKYPILRRVIKNAPDSLGIWMILRRDVPTSSHGLGQRDTPEHRCFLHFENET